jgi:hypothetical protein
MIVRSIRVAADALAVPIDHVAEALHLGRGREGVPHVGVLRDDSEQHLLAGAADHDRRVGLLHGLRETEGIGDVVMPAMHRRLLLRQHPADDLQRLLERLEPSRHRLEVDAVGAVFELEPAGADAEVEAAAADVIEGARRLRGDRRMPVRVPEHEMSDAGALRRLCERGERRETFETRTLGVDEDRIEMIERPEGVVAPGVGFLPEVEDLSPLDALLAGLNAEPNGKCRHRQSSSGGGR